MAIYTMSISKNIIAIFCTTVLLSLTSFAQVNRVSGILEPLHDAEISASVAGKIDTIHFREGENVKKDTVVIQLKNVLEQLEVNRRQVIFDSKAELEAAIAKMETLKVDLDSTRSLFEKTGVVSQEELDKKVLEYNLAVAEKEGKESEEIREGIELQMSRFQLEQRAIEAPFTGKVADVYLDEGEDCSAGEELFRLVDSSKCHFVCNVEASLAAYLKKGQMVDLEITSGLETVDRQGEIEFIAPTIDAASGLRKVKVLIDNPDFSLTPGATGELIIKINEVTK